MGLHNQQLYYLSNGYYHSRLEENEDISQKVIMKNSLENLLRRKRSKGFNHVTTLLANAEESYIMDLMNKTFYYIHGNSVSLLLQ